MGSTEITWCPTGSGGGLHWQSKKPRDNSVLYKDKDPLKQTEIDKKDEGTPDDWVPRHPDLIRLTGRHPFNVEPPLPALMEQGFITPASLHYVRNHGAVPRLGYDSHRLKVGGLVAGPREFTMDELKALPSREIPVTLVCAGNRRKEENLRKQTIGFNWGAAGHACSVWKGVLVRDVLQACGVKTPDEGANHVCFVGTEQENMPKGRYGTSINWFTAMDPACDVLLAYEQNGEPLTPDHGYPLRLIIPGYIGGRMIKWLTDITVTEAESDNFFHFNDNRVLPEHVTAEIANAEGWWYKPDYIINELNINSAIAYPGHQELLVVEGKDQKYTVQGYCYSGGGRKVIRVELSIDGGENWVLTKLTHHEKPTEYGKYWCWCFWEWEIDVCELMMLKNAELLCRGWDAAMNRQPEKLTWNVMGMMNNSYFRIKVHRCLHPESGKPALRFQHPTLAGPGNFGGWFEELTLGPAALPAPPPKPPPAPAVPNDGVPIVLSGKAWAKLPLESREELSDDTRLFRFSLPSKEHRIGLPVGQHLFIKARTSAGKVVMRAYTPVGDGPGFVDFVIKVYFANVHPRFPEGGAMTQAMEALKIGDTLEFKGPMGEYIFNTAISPTGSAVKLPAGLPTFTTTKNDSKVSYRKIGFISGGSGITPSLQTAVALLADKTLAVEEICILYANQKEKDILCKDILDDIEKDPRVKVWYTVDKALEPGWKYSIGFINEEMVREHLPAPAKDTVIFMCGPPPMIKHACLPNLDKVGHGPDNCYCF